MNAAFNSKDYNMRDQHQPSEADIRRQCLEIQTDWDEKEEWKRAGLTGPRTWMPPNVAPPVDFHRRAMVHAEPDKAP